MDPVERDSPMSDGDLVLKVHVSPRAAVMAGKVRAGVLSLAITEADLGTLSQEQKEEVARLLEESEVLGSLPGDLPIGEPTMAAVLPAIDCRIAARVAAAARRRADDIEEGERLVAASRGQELKDAARAKALREWVDKNGEDDQRARMTEGYLRQDEMLDMVTQDLLDLPHAEYAPARRGEACDCPCAGSVEFTASAPLHMDQSQYGQLKKIREDAPEGAVVEPINHVAKCPLCRCVPLSRLSARVSLPWHGWLLRRDFQIK
jgi:hypothetical protein